MTAPSNLSNEIEKLKRSDNMILYTDTVKGRQACRDDLWAISTEELEALTTLFNKQIVAELRKIWKLAVDHNVAGVVKWELEDRIKELGGAG